MIHQAEIRGGPQDGAAAAVITPENVALCVVVDFNQDVALTGSVPQHLIPGLLRWIADTYEAQMGVPDVPHP